MNKAFLANSVRVQHIHAEVKTCGIILHLKTEDVFLIQAMSRSGLAGPSMENHMDMSHLQMPKHMSVPPQEEPSDLEELEQFAKAFKQRRIKLGFTQVIKRENLG